MEVQTKQQLKSFGINLGSIAGAITLFYTLYYANVLRIFDQMIIFGYTLTQLAFMVLIAIGVGLILYPVISGKKSLGQAKDEIESFLKETTGASDEKIKSFEDRLAKDIKGRLGLFAKKTKRSRKRDVMALSEAFPSPASIRDELFAVRNTLLLAIREKRTILMDTRNSKKKVNTVNEIDMGEKLAITTARAVEIAGIELYTEYKKRSMKIILIMLAIAFIAYIISYFIGI